MTNDINPAHISAVAEPRGHIAAAVSDTELAAPCLARPHEILDDPTLSIAQKRSTLASWLSDKHAVPDAPRWRQLDNGAFVDSHEIWQALYILDDAETDERRNSRTHASPSLRRRQRRRGRRWISTIISRKRDDDDDDPPPTPAAMRLPIPNNVEWDEGSLPGVALAA